MFNTTPTDLRALIPYPLGGHLALCAYPGLMIDPTGALAILPERLQATVQQLQDTNCRALYRLIEANERLSDDALILDAAQTASIACVDFPIADYHTPSASVIAALTEDAPRRQAIWAKNQCLAIHCHAGAGRSGLIAAWLCMDAGMTASQAITHVRQFHPEAVETAMQEQWLQDHQSERSPKD